MAENMFDRFTVFFTGGTVFLDGTAFPLGQLTTDVLNLDNEILTEIDRRVNDFIDLKEVLHSRQGLWGLLWMFAGILLILFPSLAIQGIGGAAAFAGLLWSGRKIMDTAFDDTENRKRKRRKLFLYMAFLCLMTVLMCNYQAVMISMNLAIGVVLVLFAFSRARKLFSETRRTPVRVFFFAESLLYLLLGLVSIITPNRVFTEKILTVGSFFILYGIGKILIEMFQESKNKNFS